MSDSSDARANEVCIVDDDPSVLKSMHYLLASEGFKVRPFSKARDFLAHAGTHHVPVVVTDIWMDQVTGLELLARLCGVLVPAVVVPKNVTFTVSHPCQLGYGVCQSPELPLSSRSLRVRSAMKQV